MAWSDFIRFEQDDLRLDRGGRYSTISLPGLARMLMDISGATPTPSIGEPQNIVPVTPSVAPMGRKTSDTMAGYTPGDVGDPIAMDLDPVQKSFLNAVSTGESRGRYDVRYTPQGGMRFTDFSKHPGIFEPGPEGPSSAAGRYQFTKSTWDSLGGGPFDPTIQDIRGWQLAERDYRTRTGRDLSEDLKSKGFTPEVAKALSDTWTSFRNPSVVKQAQMVFEQSRKKYEGGTKMAGDVVKFPSQGNEFFNADGTPRPFEEITERANKRLTNERLMKSLGGGVVIPFIPKRPGVGPDAAPGPGGGLSPLTDERATPEQQKNFSDIITVLPEQAQLFLMQLPRMRPVNAPQQDGALTFENRFYGSDPSRYPTIEDAKKYGAGVAYGRPQSAFLEPNTGVSMRETTIPNAVEAFNEEGTLKDTKRPIDENTRINLQRAYMAAKRSAIAMLGFKPEDMVFSDSAKEKTNATINGFTMVDYKRKTSPIMWQNLSSPTTALHESLHAGLFELQNNPMYAKLFRKHGVKFTQDNEEAVVRALIYRNFGDAEAEGNRSFYPDDKNFTGRNKPINEGRKLAFEKPKFLDDLEELAQKVLAKKRPERGPA